jgi:hypothetical protein
MAAVVAVALTACTGTLSSASGPDAGTRRDLGPPSDAAPPRDGDTPPPPPEDGATPDDLGTPGDAGTPPPFDGGACPSGDLRARLSLTPIAGASLGYGAAPFAAALPGGGAAVAYAAGGEIIVQRLGGDGSPFGAPVRIEGNSLWGFDATADALGVLVARGADALYLVVVAHDGTPRFSRKLLGEVPHDVVGNEWFGNLLRYGRLRFLGREWVAYYTVNRLWPDGIAHYGDQLRSFHPDGADARTYWDWGCSHSMEVRLAHNGARLAPVCSSDCYPSKGVHFDHRGGMLWPDETGSNCAGRYGTTLGDVVPVEDGFWVTFTAIDMRASSDVALVKVDNAGRIGDVRWVTADGTRDSAVRAARYGAGLLVAWSSDEGSFLARYDLSGALVEGPVAANDANVAGASDLFNFDAGGGAPGDVGWVTSGGGGLALARLRRCD